MRTAATRKKLSLSKKFALVLTFFASFDCLDQIVDEPLQIIKTVSDICSFIDLSQRRIEDSDHILKKFRSDSLKKIEGKRSEME